FCDEHRIPSSLPLFPTRRSSDLCATLRGGGASWKLGADRRSIARLCDILSELRSQRSLMKILILAPGSRGDVEPALRIALGLMADRKSTRLNSSHVSISYAVFCL